MLFPALVVVAALAALAAFLRSEAGRVRRRGMLLVAGVAAALSVAGVVPLMGIPGAVVYELSAPLVRALVGGGYAELGDAAWPAAIVLTLAWPSSLVVAYALAFGPLRHGPGWARRLALVLVPCAAGLALSVWAQLAAR